jgi:hypothetical protein
MVRIGLVVSSTIMAALAGSVMLAGVRVGSHHAANAGAALPPDLRALPAADLRIASSGAQKYLRFSTTSWNGGAGKLHLVGGPTDPDTDTQIVYQQIFNVDGTYTQYEAGSFIWHADHGHVHFDDYAIYILRPVTPGPADRVASKMTFCIIDTTPYDLSLPGAPQTAQYVFCDGVAQGMSVGWGDTYGWYLAGQEIDITGLPNGDYWLKIEIDPEERIIESDDGNNSSTILIRITNNSVSQITPTPTATPTRTSTSTATPTLTRTPTATATPTPAPATDSDGDGCSDAQEAGADPVQGGDRDAQSPWDFFDVPAPAGPDTGADGRLILSPDSVRDRAVSLHDVGVVLAYVGRNGSNAAYVADNNLDGASDGTQLDRAPSADPAKLWRSGPPNGGISLQDVGVALAQVGHSCAP